MKYNYPQLQGICGKAIRNNLCTGCNRLELLDFKGLQECKHITEKQNYLKEILGVQEKLKI